MVYSRYVNVYGPYLYRSEREGETVHSIYLGPGARPIRETGPHAANTYTTIDKFKDQDQTNPLIGPGPQAPKPKKKKLVIEHKTKEETKLTYLERAHLYALCKKYDIDHAEIDHKISYEENKDYLDRLAKENSYSQEDRQKAELEAETWKGAYKDFMEDLSEDSEKWKDYF